MRRIVSFAGSVSFLAAGLVLGGCADGPGAWTGLGADEPPGAARGAPPVADQGTQLTDGWLAGDMGDVHDFSGDADPESSYLWTFGDRTEIILHTNGDDWAAMALLFVEGDLREPRSVDAIGCSGPRNGGWDFDAPALEVSITPELGDDGRVDDIAFDMTFPDGSHAAGSVQTTAAR